MQNQKRSRLLGQNPRSVNSGNSLEVCRRLSTVRQKRAQLVQTHMCLVRPMFGNVRKCSVGSRKLTSGKTIARTEIAEFCGLEDI